MLRDAALHFLHLLIGDHSGVVQGHTACCEVLVAREAAAGRSLRKGGQRLTIMVDFGGVVLLLMAADAQPCRVIQR